MALGLTLKINEESTNQEQNKAINKELVTNAQRLQN
jgi:hypothetical protein